MTEKEYLERRLKELNSEIESIMQRKVGLEKGSDNLPVHKDPPRMMTIKEAARATHLAENYIRYLCKNGHIIFVKAGNKYLINYEKLLGFLNGEEER